MLHNTTMQTQALIENSNRLLQKTAASLATLPGGASSANAVAAAAAAAASWPALTAPGPLEQQLLTVAPQAAAGQAALPPGISAAAASLPAATTFVVVSGNLQPQMIPRSPGAQDAIVHATVEDVQGTCHRVQCPASAISTGGEPEILRSCFTSQACRLAAPLLAEVLFWQRFHPWHDVPVRLLQAQVWF